MPVIILRSVGAGSDKLRKTAVMRVEHDSACAVAASLSAAPKHSVWYFNIKAEPHVELQDGAAKHYWRAREVSGDEKAAWWSAPLRCGRTTRGTQGRRTGRSLSSCWSR